MSKKLLIVESPAKVKTIEKYLGKDYKVASSYGHIRDLDKGNKGVNTENFELNYVVSPGKEKVVRELKSLVKNTDEVWLATDEDREGEAISWHLCKVLGLDEYTTKRIVFREITKPAITKAIEQPRTLDLNLVDAQQARRVLDRVVGFELSELLWRKVKNKLSAGRVQSVAVKLIVEKEREVKNHQSKTYYKVTAKFIVKDKAGNNAVLKADLSKNYDTIEETRAFLEQCKGAQYSIASIDKKPSKKRPAAPFTTSTLQQDASRKLYFPVRKTMQVAQRLYEQGLISYMRTDSTTLSQTALTGIHKFIEENYGSKYNQERNFSKKNSELAQEAHEAIRPTDMNVTQVPGSRDETRLYDLIWKRTIASQMADAQIEKTNVLIDISSTNEVNFKASGEVIIFDGFLKVYRESDDDDQEEHETKGMLPPLKMNQLLDLNEIEAREKRSNAPARYTEAGLVKKLEELGIGRPSTYAPTITKIMEPGRGYVIKANIDGVETPYQYLSLADDVIQEEVKTEMTGAIKNRLMATDMGMIVTDYLDAHFANIMDYSFTAEMEEHIDEVAQGQMEWKKLLGTFYTPFHEQVVHTMDTSERATGERILGKDPNTQQTILARMGRYGPIVQIGAPDELAEDEKPRFASLQPNQSIESIELEEALELFKLPRTLGEYKGKPIIVNNGRFGPYVNVGDIYVSIPKGQDPLELSLDEALALIKQKEIEDAPIMTYKSLPVTKGKGRFGPFLKWDGMFINIPRKYDPDNLSQDDMISLLEAKIEKEKNRYVHQWPEESLAVEMGRWGPFIRFKKKSIKLPKGADGKRMTREDALELSKEQVMKLVEEEIPTAFKKKAKAKPKAKVKSTTKPKKK